VEPITRDLQERHEQLGIEALDGKGRAGEQAQGVRAAGRVA